MNKLLLILTTFLALLVSASCGDGSGPSSQAPETAANIQFTDATKASGVDFKHVATRTEDKLLPEIMGSGVAIADFNNDGAPDILLVNSGVVKEKGRPAGSENRLYINDGKGKFTDKTADWKLVSTGYGQGAAVGDFDGDGFTDVFLTNYEGDNRLLRNTGSAFEDVSSASGFSPDGKWATSAGFADLDGDGDLDLYLVRYVNFTPENQNKVYRNRMLIYTTPIYYEPYRDSVFRNDDGRFTDVTEAWGFTSEANGLALAIADIDKDGDQDIYVANDSDPNHLWVNESGKFREFATLSGSAYSEIGKAEGSMGADLTDVDSNGYPDIAVSNFQAEPTSLYSQEKALLFREISDASGIGASSRQRLKFGLDFFDADNDGDEDLLVANGHIEDNVEQSSDSVTFAQPNSLYENLGNGKFKDISGLAGDALKDVQVSRGLATADLDGDGDLDYVIVNNDGTAQIAFNETVKKGNFAIFLLRGNGKNTNAIGARLVAKIGDRTIDRQIMGAQSYLSVSDFRVHFGLGDAGKIDELTIHWPGGEQQTLRDVAGNKFYFVREGEAPREFIPGQLRVQ
ncbi:MAG TPA: CRTAC1 family protein [Aridibacter sp.]|nr:CRTAC1 family protein [Aridibacter sp.]